MPHHSSDPAAPEVVWTIVVGGGSGARFGSLKQFEQLAGRSVLDWSCETADAASDGVVVVLPASETARRPGAVAGGETRAESVRRGLAAVPGSATIICVHDAVRPFASSDLYRSVVAAVAAGADGAVPARPVTDTIKQVDAEGVVIATPARDALVAVQTPQAFRADVLRRAHASAADGTDDAALVERIGGTIRVVDGEPDNLKITHPGDLAQAAGRFAEPRPAATPTPAPAATATPTPAATPHAPGAMRIGNGLDVHRFSDDPQRPLVLAGCRFDGERGLAGHSDADAVAHAVADALLGAAGIGDIGQLFPDTDERWRGADSMQLLAHVVGLLHDDGWTVANVDCNVVCEAPKLAPRRDEMQRNLAAVLGAPATVKGRRAEGLGALGRREGVACWAVAMIERRSA